MVGKVSADLSAEMRFDMRLVKLTGESLFDGDTTREGRRERALGLIRQHRLEAVICGKNRDGKPLTFADVYEKIYTP